MGDKVGIRQYAIKGIEAELAELDRVRGKLARMLDQLNSRTKHAKAERKSGSRGWTPKQRREVAERMKAMWRRKRKEAK